MLRCPGCYPLWTPPPDAVRLARSAFLNVPCQAALAVRAEGQSICQLPEKLNQAKTVLSLTRPSCYSNEAPAAWFASLIMATVPIPFVRAVSHRYRLDNSPHIGPSTRHKTVDIASPAPNQQCFAALACALPLSLAG